MNAGMIEVVQQALGAPVVDFLQRYWGPIVLIVVALVYIFGRNALGDWFDGTTDGE